MFLKSLSMQGFKSFPEKTILNFEKGITGVVGPNGSGKSNISDAVRWVLGEQSSKSLRGTKMEDVIFDGTKLRKPFGFAQVTLILDNSDRLIESVDSDEVAVTRKYFRSGESEYRINGELVRLKDVHQIFMDTGLGRDGYSMVSQGRVADLISDRNSQCREMLEEAAGISAYRYRRSDSIKKLSQAEENMLRLLDILAELEGRIGPLKTQSEKAKRFLEYSDEKKGLEISLWLAAIEKLKRDLKKHEEKLLIAENQFNASTKALDELNEEIERSIELSQSLTAEIDEKRQAISLNDEESASLSSQKAVCENSLMHNSVSLERLEAEIKTNLSGREELGAEIDAKEKIVSQITALLTSKQKELEKISAQLAAAQEAGSSIEDESKEIGEKISSLMSELADARVRESTSLSLANELASRRDSFEELTAEQESLLEERRLAKVKIEAEIKECLGKITEANNVRAGISMLLDSHREKLAALKKEEEEKNLALSSLSSKIAMLEDLEKSMDGYSGAVKAVINAAKERKLSGIDGTVSKLISVEEKTALAIETALGGAVQNIICKTEGDAKRAIEFLKKGNHGRVTFQPVSSVDGKKLSESELFDCDGFVGIASDLVNCDEEYKKIIVSLLGRIAVAEDLDYAIQIARRFSYRFKIVTLDGQVVNAGGSLTGGSKAKGAGIISRSIEIRHLSAEKEKAIESVGKLRDKIENLSEKIKEETEKSDEANAAIVSLGEERIRLEGVRRLCLEQIRSTEESLESLELEKGGVEERIKTVEAERKSCEALISSLSAEIAENEEKLVSLSEKQESLESSGKEISAQSAKLRNEILNCEKDLATHKAALDMLKLRLIEGEDKDRALEKEIEDLKAQNEEIKARIIEIDEETARLAEAKEALLSEIESAKENRAGAEKQSADLRLKEKELSAERQSLAGEKARLEERKTSAAAEYDETIAKLYDEYELSLRQAQIEYSIPEDLPASKRRLNELKNKIRALGSVNVSAIEEYKEVSERYEFMSAQLDDVEKSKAELQRLIVELTRKMSEQFREKFDLINKSFDETFSELFNGGSAELVLTDPSDILESEIEIRLQPPGKAIKRLDALSGGEKGLSAISLLFAILKVNPSPFCIFDEVEAALDDVNVGRYAKYVRRMSENTQFILITHRRGSMEEADRLYGITMQEQGVSKLLELKTAELAKELGIK